jgi:3-deoxy-manno-octulosonate cytidylyltransferase (CMP-KDO synthetase)
MKQVIIIPARYGSTRFPGKPLVQLFGKPLIQHVYERAQESGLKDIYVATDDKRIFDVVVNFGGKAIITGEHPSGTDRVWEAANILGLDEGTLIINLQGDQPLLPAEYFSSLIKPLLLYADLSMATLAVPLQSKRDLENPHKVKVVLDKRGRALYFSRSPIPFFRPPGKEPTYLKHLGVYAYRKEFLDIFVRLPQGELEQAEKLEQLRALEHGYSIAVSLVPRDIPEVDTPEDLEIVRSFWEKA